MGQGRRHRGYVGKAQAALLFSRLQGGDHIGFALGPSELGEARCEIVRFGLEALRFAPGCVQFGLKGFGVLLDVDDLRLELGDQGDEFDPLFLGEDRIVHLDDDEQQDHRAEATADTVEERKPRGSRIAAFLPIHGQSNAWLMNEPWVLRDNFQKESAP